MKHFNIKFLPSEIELDAVEGENLLDVAAKAGLHINASCGGKGVCGRCKVELVEGQLQAEPGLYLDTEDYNKGLRLACKASIVNNAVIFIPLDSRADDSLYKGKNKVLEKIDVSTVNPLVKKLQLALKPPSHDDNQSDFDRLVQGLEKEVDLKNIELPLELLKKLPKLLRDNNFALDVILYDDENQQLIINLCPPKNRSYGLALDIGTTTVWARLIDLNTAESCSPIGTLNGQISFGEDIISRIIYASKNEGLERLREKVVESLNSLIGRLKKDYPNFWPDLDIIMIAGNTTMCHLFMGVEAQNIRLAPYVPITNDWPLLKACDLGLDSPNNTVLKALPSVSSYVGGDIVSGVLASGMHLNEELTLFIDVGTNGEIVVGNKDWLTCAACSAGPAFEGGGVKFGMRAAPGAIYDFFYDEKLKSHQLQVIDNVKPLGICGSGLINISAILFKSGLIDAKGKFVTNLNIPAIREGEDGWEYLLSPAIDNAIEEDIVLTEIDIDNLIRAKGAMYSGYQSLLKGVGLEMSDLEKVIIAGGFGQSLNIENAICIGLLPDLDLKCFSYIGNSSLTGAALALLSVEKWQAAKNIKNNMTNFELSETPGYIDYYMASLFLPHTDRALFPSVNLSNKISC